MRKAQTIHSPPHSIVLADYKMFLIRRVMSSQNTVSKVVPGERGAGLTEPIGEDRDMDADGVQKDLLEGKQQNEGTGELDDFEGFEDAEAQLRGDLFQLDEVGKMSKSTGKSKSRATKKKSGGGKKGKKALSEPEIVEEEENTHSQDQDGSPDGQVNAETHREDLEEESLPKKRSARTVNGTTPRRVRASPTQAILPPPKPILLHEPVEEGDSVQNVKLLKDARVAAKTRKAATLAEADTQTGGPAFLSTTHNPIQIDNSDLSAPENLASIAAKVQKVKKAKKRRSSDVRVDGDAVFREPLTPAHVSHHTHRSPESDSAIVEDEEQASRASKKALGKRRAIGGLAVEIHVDKESKRASKRPFKRRKAEETMQSSISDVEDEEPTRLSKKALGKRKAVDEPPKDSSKRTKQIKDKGPPNGNIKNMFAFSNGRQALSEDQNSDGDHPEKQTGEDDRVQATTNTAGFSYAPIRPPPSTLIKSGQKPNATESLSQPLWNAINKQQVSGDDSVHGSSYESDPVAADTTQRTHKPSPPASPEPMVPRSSGSRKRRLPVEEAGPSNTKHQKYIGLKSQEPKSTTPKTPKTPKTPTPKPKNASATSLAAGKLPPADVTAISDAVESYKELNDLSQHEINELIQQNAFAGSGEKEFWKSIYEEVSWIPTKKVAQFCRRKYHNFEARGKWTDEQDEELRTAHERNPGKWTIIGREINRFSEDARDRWRNYLVCGDNMRKDVWDKDEENRLSLAVEECISLIHAARRRSGGLRLTEDDESLLDWNKVSEKMDYTRSRLQCSYKWKQMKKRQASDDESGATDKPISESWRLAEAYDNARVLSADKKLRLLHAIRASGAGQEGKIPWGRIRAELDESGKRMIWKVCFLRLKEKVAGYENMKFAEILEEIIDAFETAAPDEPDGFAIDMPARKQKRSFRASQPVAHTDDEAHEGESVERSSTSSKKKRKFRDRMRREDEPTQSIQDTEVIGNDASADEAPPVPNKKHKVRNETKSKSKPVEAAVEEAVVDESEDLATSLQALKSSQPRKPRAARKKAKTPLSKPKRVQVLSEEVVVEDPSDDDAAVALHTANHEDNHEAPANDNVNDEMGGSYAETQVANDDPEGDDISEEEPEISHHDMESVDLDEDHTITMNGFHVNGGGEAGEQDDAKEEYQDLEGDKLGANGYDTDEEEEEALNATQHDTESVDLGDTTSEEESPGSRFGDLGPPVAYERNTGFDGFPDSDTRSVSSDASDIPAKKLMKTSKKLKRLRLESVEL